jgi:predicted DNA-binding transcriptional regulator YafY
VRPAGFELAQAWQLITDEIDQRRTPVRARALARPDVVQLCRWILGNRVRIGAAAADGRVEIELRGHHTGSLAAEIAGLGGAVEVVEPPELRERLARVGAELTATYGER